LASGATDFALQGIEHIEDPSRDAAALAYRGRDILRALAGPGQKNAGQCGFQGMQHRFPTLIKTKPSG